MSSRSTLPLFALVLAACASSPRPSHPPAAVAAPPPAARPAETAWVDEPAPLTDDTRRALAAAGVALREGRFDGAVTALREGLARHGDDVALRIRLAYLIAEDARPDDAVRLLREGLRRRPEDADLLTFAGGVRLRQALDGATTERRRGSLTARPSTDTAADARQVRAWLVEARDAFVEGVRARPNHLGAIQGGAVTAGQLGEHADAVRAWERVAALSPDRDHQERLAQAVAASGDRRRAITLYEALVAAEPSRGDAHAALGALYAAEGRADEGRAALARARFYQWITPFTVAPTGDNVAAVATLSSWFPAEGEAPGTPEAREAKAREVRAVIARLGATRSPDARTLLAAFAWHHSHDPMEEAVFEALHAQGADAGDTLLELLQGASSACTMRHSAEGLARLRDPRAFEVLTAALPRDVGLLPINAANALELLGDARAVPSLVAVVRRPLPPADPADPIGPVGFRTARSRAVLALGGFDTPESRAALGPLVSDPDVGVEAHAALYRLTRERAHLAAVERTAGVQRPRAQAILLGYIERAGTPEATAAALRARRAAEAAERARQAAPPQQPSAPERTRVFMGSPPGAPSGRAP